MPSPIQQCILNEKLIAKQLETDLKKFIPQDLEVRFSLQGSVCIVKSENTNLDYYPIPSFTFSNIHSPDFLLKNLVGEVKEAIENRKNQSVHIINFPKSKSKNISQEKLTKLGVHFFTFIKRKDININSRSPQPDQYYVVTDPSIDKPKCAQLLQQILSESTPATMD